MTGNDMRDILKMDYFTGYVWCDLFAVLYRIVVYLAINLIYLFVFVLQVGRYEDCDGNVEEGQWIDGEFVDTDVRHHHTHHTQYTEEEQQQSLEKKIKDAWWFIYF